MDDLEIIERLIRIEERVAEVRLDTVELRRGVFGYNGTPGVVVRLDRLEVVEERRKWTIRALITVSLGLVASAAAAALCPWVR